MKNFNSLYRLIVLIAFSTIGLKSFSQCSPPNPSSLSCSSPVSFNITASGYMGNNPTAGDAGCNPCCYAGADLDCDGLQDVPYSVENSKWYKFCNTTGSTIVVDVVVDEPGTGSSCNLQGAIWTGATLNSTTLDCGNPGYNQFDSNPGGAADGFSFTNVSIPNGECVYIMVDGYAGGTCSGVEVSIICPCTPPATPIATNTGPYCQGSTIQLNTSAVAGATYSWTGPNGFTSTAQNPSITNSNTTMAGVYSVTITVGGCTSLPGSTTVTVNPLAVANASTDQTICAGSTVTLAGSVSGGATSGTWSAGSGTFSPNATTLNATFTPSAAQISAGTATLTLTTNDPAGPCPAATDQMVITINPVATVNAGPDQTICSSSTVTLAGSVGGSASSGSWSGGGGTYSPNANTLTATYTPSAAEITAGTVTLTLTTNDPAGPCTAVTDQVVITINPAATANANSDQTICAGSTVTLAGSVGGGASSGTWSAGSGTFSPNATTLNATFTPSAAQISAGTATLTLTTNDPAGICGAVTDQMIITINPVATVNAGVDQTVCSSSTVTLAGSIGGSATSATWSGGSGTFSPNATTLTATYTPTAAEITAGTVTLTLTTNDPAGPCGFVTDQMVITINPAATVSAGSDQTICAGSTVTLAGSIGGGASSGTWTAGSGTFTPNATTLNATFTPSAAQVTAGTATLTLTTNDPAGICGAVNDQMIITINPVATVNAGADQSACAGTNFSISGTIGGSASSSTWTTGGSGTFGNASSLSTTYTPSAGDISAGTVSLTLTTNDPAGPCSSVNDVLVLTINPLQNASFSYSNGTYCQTGTNPTPTITGVGGGTFTSSPAGLSINASTGTINLAASALNSYTITYTTPGPCPNSSAVAITITSAPSATFSYSGPYCQTGADPLPTFGAGASAGTFSSSVGLVFVSTSTGQIDLSASTPGTYTVFNDIAASGGCSPASASNSVVIDDDATVSASIDQTVCAGSTITLAGSIGGAASTGTWTGGGTFSPNATTLNATYTPSAAEITAGTASLTLTTNNPAGACPAVNDQMIITLNAPAGVSANVDQTICQGSTVTLAGSISGSASSGTWSGGAGTFTPGNTTLNATYTPSAAEITAGTVTLTLTTDDPAGACAAVNDQMVITINAAATVSASIDQSVCSGSTITLAGSIGGSASTATWTGGGTFSPNATTLNATYTPSAAEITAGTATLTLTTNDPAGACSAVNDQMTITINQTASVSANVDQTICAGSTVTLAGSISGSASSSTWSGGSGTFSPGAGSLNATYTPSSGDISSGSVTLTLTSDDPTGPCAAATDQMIISINAVAVVDAGSNTSICSGSSITLSGAISGSVSTGTWSGGAGTFTPNNTTLNASYSPTAAEITAGSVTLTLTSADPAGPCNPVSDIVVITINEPATVNAGNDFSICEGSDAVLAGTFGGSASSITWSSASGGTFDNANSTTAAYTPSAADLSAGSVVLTITTNDPAGACFSVTDDVTISISPTESAAFTYASSSFCIDGVNVFPTITGVAGGTFNADFGLNLLSNSTGELDIQGSIAGTYYVYYTTSGTCFGLDSFMVTINGLPDANAGPDQNITCSVPSATLAGSSTTTNAQFSWAGGSIVSGGTTATPVVNSSATYILTVTDPLTGCTNTDNVDVIPDANIPSVDAGLSQTLTCTDTIVTLTGTTGNSNTTFLWTGAGIVGNDTSLSVTVNVAGIYTLTVTDTLNGCSGSATVTVSSNTTPPDVNAGVDTLITCTTTSLTLAGSSATPNVTYSWTGPGVISGGTTTNPIIDATGTYVLTVTDTASGCTASDTVVISFDNSAFITSISADTTICAGTTVTLIAGGGTNYEWPDGSTSSSIVVTPLVTTTYYVLITEGICFDSLSVTISVNQNPTIVATATPSIVFDGETSQLNVTGGVSYIWAASTDLTCTACSNPIASPLSTTTYLVTGTDANGCVGQDTVTVIVDAICPEVFLPTAFSPNTSGLNDTWCVEGNGCIVTMSLKLYDRWGTLIYETTDPNSCWDGSFNGTEFNNGVFYYVFEATLSNGETVPINGNVTIIK